MTDEIEIPEAVEDIHCEACDAGFRRAANGLHYDDARGGITWGQCRKITEGYVRKRVGKAAVTVLGESAAMRPRSEPDPEEGA